MFVNDTPGLKLPPTPLIANVIVRPVRSTVRPPLPITPPKVWVWTVQARLVQPLQ